MNQNGSTAKPITDIINDAELGAVHWKVFAITAFGLVFDGFDLQATAYAGMTDVAPVSQARRRGLRHTPADLAVSRSFGLFRTAGRPDQIELAAAFFRRMAHRHGHHRPALNPPPSVKLLSLWRMLTACLPAARSAST